MWNLEISVFNQKYGMCKFGVKCKLQKVYNLSLVLIEWLRKKTKNKMVVLATFWAITFLFFAT